jgi:AAA ATPase domain
MDAVAVELIGRDAELVSITGFLDSVDAGPAALVLSGEPGIGKTVLWELGVEDARARFGRVLSCRAAEAEAALSFSGMSELLTDVFDEVVPSLPPLRRRAIEVALLLAEPGAQPPDALAIGLALLDVLRILGERAPLVVALDDLQWLDPVLGRGAPDSAAAPSPGAGPGPGHGEGCAGVGPGARLPRGAAHSAVPVSARADGAPCAPQGASFARAVAFGARSGAGRERRQPVLRPRART